MRSRVVWTMGVGLLGLAIGLALWPVRGLAAPELGGRTADPVHASDAAQPHSGAAREAAATRSDVGERGLAGLHGRCVDERAQPLAGVRVVLRRHDEAERPALTTAADGRFAFSFAPPDGYGGVELTRGDLIRTSCTWDAIAPGSDVDAGDIVLCGGCVLRGLVVDEQGTPIDNELVMVHRGQRAGSRDGESVAEEFLFLRSGADGKFAAQWPVAAGHWSVITQHALIEPGDFAVAPDQRDAFLHVVVAGQRPDDVLTGVVVDELGAPVFAAAVRCSPVAEECGYRQGDTNRDGVFRIARGPGDPSGRRALTATKAGFEEFTSGEVFSFGQDDVRIVLRRGASVTLHATDAETGAPIDAYTALLIPRPKPLATANTQRFQSEPRGGACTLEPLTSGSYAVIVEPRDSGYLAATTGGFLVGGGVPTQLEVRVPRAAEQTVRVLCGTTPVAGATVHLGLALDRLESASSVVTDTASISANAGAMMIAYATGTTDARGEVRLRGPRKTPCAVWVASDAHATVKLAAAVFDGAEPLVVQVAAGAALNGRLHPANVVNLLRAAASTFGIRLRRSTPDRSESYPEIGKGRVVPVAEDGAFLLRGIPAGSWEVRLTTSDWQSRALSEVTVVDGDQRDLDIDVSALEPGTLRGRVDWDGAPYAGKVFMAVGVPEDGAGTDTNQWQAVYCDDHGAFAAQCPPGRAWLQIAISDPNRLRSTVLRSDETVVVEPGHTTEVEFHVHSTEARWRVVDSRGNPASAVVLYLSAPGHSSFELPPTDDRGMVRMQANVGVWQVRAAKLGATQEQALPVGTFTVAPGANGAIEVTLPWVNET